MIKKDGNSFHLPLTLGFLLPNLAGNIPGSFATSINWSFVFDSLGVKEVELNKNGKTEADYRQYLWQRESINFVELDKSAL